MNPSTFFGQSYITLLDPYLHGEAFQNEIKFINNIIKPKSRILDVCCGHGRHSIELAMHGHIVTGIDLNEEAIEQAIQTKIKRKISHVHFYQGDILELLPRHREYNVALLLCNIIGMLKNKDKELLEKTKDSLNDGGMIILSISNRDHLLKRIAPLIKMEINGHHFTQERIFNIRTSELTAIDLRKLNGKDEESYMLVQRLYSCHEILDLVSSIGYRNVRVFGDFTNDEATLESDNLVIVAEK